MRLGLHIILLLAILGGGAGHAWGGGYIQITGLIDTRTTFSDGDLSVDALARLASARGFDAVFYNDHDRMVMAYGQFPLQHVLRKKEERNGIHLSGVDTYLDAIQRARQKHPDLILVPGCESSPYYYWSGSYFNGDLTANDHEKRLLAIGLERPADYRDMPVIHNRLTTRYTGRFIPAILFFTGTLAMGIFLVTRRGWRRYAGICISSVSVLLLINTAPFRSTPYDQYMGDQGIAPYQLYIDYVESAGGLSFWNYPETRSGVRKLGPIRLNTPPYPDVLRQAKNYTGFAAIYGDTITVTEPGRQWDHALLEYCRGRRTRPVWGISTADFHKEAGSGEMLGNFPTVFLVREKSKSELLSAMRAGRMYAVRGRYPRQMILDRFIVSGTEGDSGATLGETIEVTGSARIRVALSINDFGTDSVRVRIVRGGEVIRTVEGPLPIQTAFEDAGRPGEKTFYRVMVKGRGAGRLISNPIFVNFR